MAAIELPAPLFTTEDVMADLESGRSLPLRPADRLLSLPARRRSAMGGPRFLLTYLAARALGRLHARLAVPALLRLWFTPWVHPSATRPVTDLADDLVAWSLRVDGSVVPGGRTLHGFSGGQGPTVVLVHGWAGRAADWRHLAGDLIAAGWRVVVPDLPAHGTTGGRRVDMFQLGRALAEVLRTERPAAVVSHSMGFPMTLFALEHGGPAPDRWVALAPGRRMRRAFEAFVRRARLRPALVAALESAIEERYGRDIWQVLDVDPSLAALDLPGVVVHDLDDDEVPVEDGRAIAEGWPSARLVETEELGHRRILRDERVRALVVTELTAEPIAG